MTTTCRLQLICFIGLFSCSTADTSTKSESTRVDTTQQFQTETVASIADTVKRFSVDDYPVTDDMLDDKTSNNSSYPKQSGGIHSFDKAWFTNDTFQETAVFEMYTDKHRLVTFHFYNDDIPDALIHRMELHVNGELASFEQKKKNFKGFMNLATKIDSKYFTTYKGFKLGDSKNKALKVYGKPDSVSTKDGVEKLYWDFFGDVALYDNTFHPAGKPLAKNSFGHQITMFFRNNKLIGLIFHNDIP